MCDTGFSGEPLRKMLNMCSHAEIVFFDRKRRIS
jgi:hypothetical protein